MSSRQGSDDDEYDSDEPAQLDLDLDKLMERASAVFSARCLTARRINRGASHEIFLLEFEPVSAVPEESTRGPIISCIARFARVNDATTTAKEEGEIATIHYLKDRTTLPVPEIFHYDLDPKNDIGAPYVLMERLPGRHLFQTWDELSLSYKKAVLTEVASVTVQLSSLRFDKIGSLRLSTAGNFDNNSLGPIFSPCYESPQGPFASTEEFFQSFIEPDSVQSLELREHYRQIGKKLSDFFADKKAAYFQPPFAFIHGDFDAQNMLFSDTPEGPRLTGLIDFEYSFTGPLHFVYEHPIFIQDVDIEPDCYAENALLRAHFVRQIFLQLPDAETRRTFIACMNEKSYTLNRFYECFMYMKCSEKTLLSSSFYYLKTLEDGTGLPYSGRRDYKVEKYSDEAEPLHPEEG